MLERKNVELVNSNFKKFKNLPGSIHIASRSSQLNLLEIVQDNKLLTILDYGSGIGTITNLMFESTCANIDAVEKIEWCRNQFQNNLVASNRIKLYSKIPAYMKYDLIIIDDEISISELKHLFRDSHSDFYIFIEGWRNLTVAKASFLLLAFCFKVDYQRCSSRLNSWNELGVVEKAGSIMKVKKSTYRVTLKSWVSRAKKTQELREFRDWLLNKTKIFKLLAFLQPISSIRKLLGLNKKERVKNWRKSTENRAS